MALKLKHRNEKSLLPLSLKLLEIDKGLPLFIGNIPRNFYFEIYVMCSLFIAVGFEEALTGNEYPISYLGASHNL
jgi:hypothetical protein